MKKNPWDKILHLTSFIGKTYKNAMELCQYFRGTAFYYVEHGTGVNWSCLCTHWTRQVLLLCNKGWSWCLTTHVLTLVLTPNVTNAHSRNQSASSFFAVYNCSDSLILALTITALYLQSTSCCRLWALRPNPFFSPHLFCLLVINIASATSVSGS